MSRRNGVPGGPSAEADPSFLVWLARKALSAGFYLLYHQLAPAYDPISWIVSGGRWQHWRRAALSDLPPGRILEIGPGTGHLLLELLESGRDAYGVESSPEMLRIARRRLSTHGHEGRLVPGDARRLPFGAATFDGVVLTFPAPFLEERFWREASRVLRPGAALVVVLSAESRRWPWPGALEWALARLTGSAEWECGADLPLAQDLVGRLVDRPVGRSVARLIVAVKTA